MELINKNIRNGKTEYKYNFYWFDEVNIYEVLKDLIYSHRTRERKAINESIERVKIGARKSLKTFLNIPCGFDIETTTVSEDFATMYCWQFSIWNTVIMGNKWQEFIDLLTFLKDILNPKKSQRLIVWIHNASYEYGFLKHYLNILDEYDYFFTEVRSQLNFTHYGFIQFRDSLRMVNGSLELLAETYDLTTAKCKGDLDYNIKRTWASAKYLTKEELQYCHNDVLILSEFSTWYFNEQLKNNKNPLTITGIVRNAIKDNTTDDEKAYLRTSKPTTEYLYNFLSQKVYRGGYTHANEYIVGCLFNNPDEDLITGFDFTSSYPSCLLYEKFPLGKWRKYCKTDQNDLLRELIYCIDNDYACVFKASLKGVKRRSGIGHSIESQSKVFDLKNATLDNGRIFSGDFTTYITEQDYLSYKDFYTWESMTIEEMYISKKEYIPNGIVKTIITYYTNKSVKKHEKKPYKLDKALCNCIYGMFCTRKPVDKISIDDNNNAEKIIGGADDFEVWNEKENNYLPIGVGVYTSAYARRNLLENVAKIEKLGKIILYCDTDSLKILQTDSVALQVIEDYNKKIAVKRDNFFKRYPEVNKAVFDDLGMFDYEYGEVPDYNKTSEHGKVTHFKTLGTKRYLISADENNQTISGLSKGILFKGADTPEKVNKVYEKFDNKLEVKDCKLYPHFNEETTTKIIFDEVLQKEIQCTEKSSISLIPTNFNLSIERFWLDRIQELEQERTDSIYEYRKQG